MRYENFRSKVNNIPILSGSYLRLLTGKPQTFKNQLVRWENKGKILKLKKDLYILNKNDRLINPSRMFIASELYKPSYISLEFALSLYGLIPERVVDITSVTSKKTKTFENTFGKFIYQHIKNKAFTGFVENKDEANLSYFIATPEKALTDFLYLNLKRFTKDYKSLLFQGFRLQNIETLNKKNLLRYAEMFGNKKLLKIIKEVN